MQGFAGSAIGAVGGMVAGESGLVGSYGDGITELQLARAAISAAAGCAASAAAGGKCAPAAVTAAFASLYNGDGPNRGLGGNSEKFPEVGSLEETREDLLSLILGRIAKLGATGTMVLTLGGDTRIRPIALGLQDYLDPFTESVGGQNYKEWARNASSAEEFRTAFQSTVFDSHRPIAFNLTGIDNVMTAVSRAASGIGGYTDWELLQIYSNPALQARTTFYKGGKVTGNPFK